MNKATFVCGGAKAALPKYPSLIADIDLRAILDAWPPLAAPLRASRRWGRRYQTPGDMIVPLHAMACLMLHGKRGISAQAARALAKTGASGNQCAGGDCDGNG